MVPVQTGKFLVNRKEEGIDPKKDEGRLRDALGIAENGLGFRKNSNEKGDKLPDARSPFAEC